MDTLYATDSRSPKLNRKLADCAKELGTQVNRIDRVLSVRWVTSSCRTVKVVWKSYTALHEYFCEKAIDA